MIICILYFDKMVLYYWDLYVVASGSIFEFYFFLKTTWFLSHMGDIGNMWFVLAFFCKGISTFNPCVYVT